MDDASLNVSGFSKEKLAAIPEEKGEANPPDHQVVRKISGIEEFAQRQARRPFHEGQAGLKAENARVQPHQDGVEETGDEHVVQSAGFAIEPDVQGHRIKMADEIERPVGRTPGLRLNQDLEQGETRRVGRHEKRPEGDGATVDSREPWIFDATGR